MKQKNLNLLNSVAAFALNAEKPTEQLTQAEVAERLEAAGVDLMKLDALTVRSVTKLRARLESTSPRKALHFGYREQFVAGKIEGDAGAEIPAVDEAAAEDVGDGRESG